MNSDIVVKHEEDPLSYTEIKAEPPVSYKFFILYFVLSLHKTTMTDIETHLNILQDVLSKIKMEAEECEHADVKQEQCLAYQFVPFLKIKKEVRTIDFVYFNVFIYQIYCLIMMC